MPKDCSLTPTSNGDQTNTKIGHSTVDGSTMSTIQNNSKGAISKNTPKQDNSTSENNEWSQTKNAKRLRDSPEKLNPAKQQKLNYWLSNKNRFEALSVDEDEDKDKEEKVPKPPPIFVDKVENIHPLITMLNKFATGNYEIRVISHNRVKVQPKNPEIFSEIVKQLESKNTEFYTYKPKNERSFKVILRNVHPSVEAEEIKSALQEHGHVATNVWNMKHRQTKRPLPMFVVELEQKSNNKEIYNITSLLHSRVIFEPPRPKRSLPQCSRCQHYGHTKSGCRRQPKCIKCAGDHASASCEKTTRSNDVKCVLCSGNHPANYKGCAIYKKLQSSAFPTLRKKVLPPKVTPNSSNEQQSQQPLHTSHQTYAQVASGLPNQTNLNNESQQTSTLISEMREMMKFLKEIMSQITSLTNLLVKFIPNPTRCP